MRRGTYKRSAKSKITLTAVATKANCNRIKETVTKNGFLTISKAAESTIIPMAMFTSEIGKKTNSMGPAHTYFKTEKGIRVHWRTGWSTGRGLTFTWTGTLTRGSGQGIRSMAREGTFTTARTSLMTASGLKEKRVGTGRPFTLTGIVYFYLAKKMLLLVITYFIHVFRIFKFKSYISCYIMVWSINLYKAI